LHIVNTVAHPFHLKYAVKYQHISDIPRCAVIFKILLDLLFTEITNAKLTDAWERKHIFNGEELALAPFNVPKGPDMGIVMDKLMEYQLMNPNHNEATVSKWLIDNLHNIFNK